MMTRRIHSAKTSAAINDIDVILSSLPLRHMSELSDPHPLDSSALLSTELHCIVLSSHPFASLLFPTRITGG